MNKINIWRIIYNHIKTLRDSSGKLSLKDISFHTILPSAISLFLVYKTGIIHKDILSSLVNFGAITTALLMSAVVMIYDQKNKVKEKLAEDHEKDRIKRHLYRRENLYSQLCCNICYSIISSIIVVVLSIACTFNWFEQSSTIPSPISHDIYYSIFCALSFIIYFFFSSTIITFLMIMKRFSYVLES